MVPFMQMYILRKVSMAAIKSALSLQLDGIADFYICSLSSRCVSEGKSLRSKFMVTANSNQFHCNFDYPICAELLFTRVN